MSFSVDLIDVVVRCRNEMPYARRTLEGLAAQRVPSARVFFIDCGSTDGSREVAVEAGVEIYDLRPEDYIPGAVLNLGMRRTTSPIVAFINADAIPLEPDSLARLVAPLGSSDSIAATFGRQLARSDADPLTQADHRRAFGPDARPPVRRGAFFSMAASAIRRDVWSMLQFDENLRYSEDVDWTRRLEALGLTTQYVPEALFEHSHRYDLRAHFRRRTGEGTADRGIFRLGAPSVVKDLARPLAGALLRDLRAGCLSPQGVLTRVVQASGYFMGRRQVMNK